MSEIDNNKRIAKNTMLLYFRMLFTMLVSFYTSRVVLRTLGVSDFGLYNVVGGFVVMLSFLNSSMTNASQRFLSYDIGKKCDKSLRETYGLTLTIHLFLAFLVFLSAETIGLWFVNYQLNISEDRIFAANILYQFAVLTSIMGVMSVPYNSLIIAHENMKAFAYICVFEVGLKLIIVCLLQLSINLDKLILYGFLIFSVSFIVCSIYYIYCRLKYPQCKAQFIWNSKRIAEMSSFAGWNLFGNLASVGQNQGVNILINIFAGTIVNAARGIAFQIQGMVMQFVVNFYMAINPQLVKMYATGHLYEMRSLIERSCKFSFYILWVFSFPLVIEMPFFLELWLGNIVPNHTILFSRLVIINVLIISLSYPLSMSVQATGKIKFYQICVSCLLFMNLPISYILLKCNYFPEITLYISLFLEVIALAFRVFVLNKLIQFSISQFVKKVLFCVVKVALLSSFFVFLMLYTLYLIHFRSPIFICLSTFFITLFVTYCFGLNSYEKVFINSQINKIRNIRK